MTNTVVVLGALSDIAEAVCRQYATEHAKLVLAARDAKRLEAVADDLRLRGAADVQIAAGDLTKMDPEECIAEWAKAMGGIDIVLLAYGVLGDQRALEKDLNAAAALIDTNFRSAALWSIAAANHFEKARAGTLAVIGSVAGDRGRQSNYLYGATKAALAVVVQGLAHRLAPVGARAVIVKPGFVDTAMTAHIANKGALWSSPETVAGLIRKATDSGKTMSYAPGYWRLIMAVIKNMPAPVLHRTKL